MASTQSLKIYEIDKKFERKKNQLATKEDINRLEKLMLQIQIDIEKRFQTQLITIVSTMIAIVGIIIAIIKL